MSAWMAYVLPHTLSSRTNPNREQDPRIHAIHTTSKQMCLTDTKGLALIGTSNQLMLGRGGNSPLSTAIRGHAQGQEFIVQKRIRAQAADYGRHAGNTAGESIHTGLGPIIGLQVYDGRVRRMRQLQLLLRSHQKEEYC